MLYWASIQLSTFFGELWHRPQLFLFHFSNPKLSHIFYIRKITRPCLFGIVHYKFIAFQLLQGYKINLLEISTSGSRLPPQDARRTRVLHAGCKNPLQDSIQAKFLLPSCSPLWFGSNWSLTTRKSPIFPPSTARLELEQRLGLPATRRASIPSNKTHLKKEWRF
jgi:hypothetical protein